jgi:hypothetical protein
MSTATSERMPTFGNTASNGLAATVAAATNISNSGGLSAGMVAGIFMVLAALVIVAYLIWGAGACDIELTRGLDGSLTLQPSGRRFANMNEFQQWWHSSGANATCPLPLMTGAREVAAGGTGRGPEEMWANTPINKVDDYEFSRIFGYEVNDRMEIPRQNFNMILHQRSFDWADRPVSSDDRKSTYLGLVEGFTAEGDMTNAREAAARFGELRGKAGDDDLECKMSREAREVAHMVARAYESDPNFEPVVTKVGPNQWEVTELKPRRRVAEETDIVVDERVVDTNNDAVDIKFRYGPRTPQEAIDPYFPSIPFESDRRSRASADPFYGPVPGMERMFGPTFDHKRWY